MSGLADHGDKCQCSECTGPRGLKACLVCDSPSALGEIERLRKQVTDLHLRRSQAEDDSNARGIEVARLRTTLKHVQEILHYDVPSPAVFARLDKIVTAAIEGK